MKTQERANPHLKRLDYYIGVPLLFLLSLFCRRRPNPPTLREIACLKSSAIGDTVLVSALIRDLKTRFPEAKVTLFTGSSNAQAAQIFAGADQVISLPMSRPWKALRIVRAQPFDVMIDFDSWPRINALLTLLSRARWTLGFETRGQGRGRAYDKVAVHREDQHEIENYRNLIRPLGVVTFHDPEIPWPASSQSGSRVLVFHAWPGGSRADEKLWSNAKWVELAQKARALGWQVGLSTGPQDLEKSRELQALAPDLFQIISPKGLRDLLSVLREAPAVVSVDTGVAHLAGALGVKTLALYGPTSPRRWGALGRRVICLKDSQRVSINLGFESVDSVSPGVQLSVEEVFSALSRLLADPS